MEKIKLFSVDGRTVYAVDGSYVISHMDSEFDRGGNGYACWYIPLDEIWLDMDDSRMSGSEPSFVLIHELYESMQMKDHAKGYDTAHAMATDMENRFRASGSRSSYGWSMEGFKAVVESASRQSGYAPMLLFAQKMIDSLVK